MELKVIDVFQDKYNGQVYAVGTIIEISDKERAADLVARNLVEEVKPIIEEVKPIVRELSVFGCEFTREELVNALKTVGVQIPVRTKDETIIKKIAELDSEKTAIIKEFLGC